MRSVRSIGGVVSLSFGWVGVGFGFGESSQPAIKRKEERNGRLEFQVQKTNQGSASFSVSALL